MSLERIIKKSMSTAALAALYSGCSPKYTELPLLFFNSQTTTAAALENIPSSGINPLGWNGSLATGVGNMRGANQKKLAALHYGDITFYLDYEVHVSGIMREGDSGKPILLADAGFLTDKFSPPTHHLIKDFADSAFEGYTIVILDDPTGASFILNNNNPSWGGIEGGYILTEVAKQLKATHPQSSLHVIGVSMGGLNALHTAYRGEGVIDSVLTLSAVTDLLDVPTSVLRLLTAEGVYGRRVLDTTLLLNKIGLEVLFANFFRTLHQDPAFSTVVMENVGDFFAATDRYILRSQNTPYLDALLSPYLADGIIHAIPTNLGGYLSASDGTRIASAISVPVFMIHAADDPAVPRSHFDRFQFASRWNTHIQGTLYRNGGHNGFSVSRGRQWEVQTLKTYVEFWSPQNQLLSMKNVFE